MDRVYINNLFDIYKSLLTEHERNIFSYYYEEDLSLMEIASNENVSRAAISKTINNVENKLIDLEDKLGIYHKNEEIIKALDNKNYDKIKSIIKG